MKETCWVLTGPTASGKTALSLRLARTHDCEIVCMDSMQIYRGMDIGTAKPTADERVQAVHHMVDVADPTEDFSVARYQEMAESCIADIQARGHRALLVGGTGLYLRALRQPMAMGEAAADESIRQELQQIADAPGGKAMTTTHGADSLPQQIADAPGGKEQLHQQLAAVDPDTAQRLHLNDVRRVIRALEVYRLTGRPFSQQPQIKTDSRFCYRVASLTMPRDILYARIEQRIDQMLADGLAEEVSRLLKSGVPRDAKAMKAIGYKEMIPYALGETTLDEAVYALKLNTRHYAKRQLTWMRREEDVLWVDALEPDAYDKLEAYYTQGEAK